MHAVVSLLDETHARRVVRLWERIRGELGLEGVWATPYPHFSYHVAGSYDRSKVEAVLSQLSAQVPSFRLRTSSVAVSEDDFPTVYVSLAMSPALRQLHERIWATVDPHAHEAQVYYRPGAWVPHVSLAHGDGRSRTPLTPDEVASVLELLRGETWDWEMPVGSLSLFWDDGVRQDLARTFPLR